MPPNREHARLLIRGTVGSCVEIPDWTQFRTRYDTTVRALLAAVARRDGRGGEEDPKKVLRRLRRWWRMDKTAAE